ncbi:transposase/IS protein [compost metagenome]
MDLIEDRNQKRSTIFCSQLPIKNWHDLIEQKAISDAILDRIIHSAIRFTLAGDSMRKKMKK